ncbi:MAG TPA: DUF2723 domain-containing protein, partial [Candidatus Limnocylindrales bacterium]
MTVADARNRAVGSGILSFGRLSAVVVPVAVAGVAFALARAALLPGLGLWDTAELQVVGPLMGTAHPTGYPTYVLLAWLASVVLQPLGEPAFRVNLLAALLAAATAGLVAHLVRRLTGRPVLALGVGLAVATLPVVWRLGTHADVHGLHGAFLALLLVLLVEWESRETGRVRDRWLVAAGVTYGLSIGNQGLTLLLALGIALFVVAADRAILRRPRFLAACALAVAVPAALIYLELPLRAGLFRAPLVYGHPETLGGFLYVVSGVQFAATFDTGGLLGRLVEAGASMRGQVGLLVLLVPVAAAVTAVRRPRYALLTIPTFLLTAWFATAYVNAEIDRYWLGPSLITLSWFAIAADAVGDGWRTLTRSRGAAPLEIAACLIILAPLLVDPGARFAAVDRS